MSNIYDKLKSDFEKLKRKDKNLKIFGSECHKYIFNPILTEDYISSFENEHEISLPTDYRLFLKEVGNGGAGPYYGMFKLEDFYQSRLGDNSGINIGRNFLQTPFLYTIDNPFVNRDWDENLTDEEYVKECNKDISGTITLSHHGCGYFDMLIVSGEEKGKVWHDATISHCGMKRIFDSFTEWYCHWLKKSMKEYKKQTISSVLY